MNHKGRLAAAQLALEQCRVEALLVTHLPNIRYLCGFTGSAGMLAVVEKHSVLFTDGRYTQQAREEVRGAIIRICKNPMSCAAEWLSKRHSARRIGIEGQHMTVADRNMLAKLLPSGRKIVGAAPI